MMVALRRAPGFTLVELLITVGILCILAAIAIPNLIDAQTRSKVARVKNDLHVLAAAIERYGEDNMHYPVAQINCGLCRKCGLHPQEPPPHTACETREAYWLFHVYSLTTPIAYLRTTIHPDPFIHARGHRHAANKTMVVNYFYIQLPDTNEVIPAVAGNFAFVPLERERDPVNLTYMYAQSEDFLDAMGGFPRYKEPGGWVIDNDVKYSRVEDTQERRPGYYLVSVGPDGISGPDYYTGGLWNIGCYIMLNDHTPEHKNTFDAWQYDPSNGTTSAGDIFRYGIYKEE